MGRNYNRMRLDPEKSQVLVFSPKKVTGIGVFEKNGQSTIWLDRRRQTQSETEAEGERACVEDVSSCLFSDSTQSRVGLKKYCFALGSHL